MSRGPGRWQRAILERLQHQEQFFLLEIVPPSAPPHDRSRSAWRAAMRAAHRLAKQGLIALDNEKYGWSHFYWTGERYLRLNGLIIARAGLSIDRRALIDEYEQRSSQEIPALSTWVEAFTSMLGTPKVSVYTSLRDEPTVSVYTSTDDDVGTSAVPTLKPFQLGAVASAVKVLAADGPVTDALIFERMSGIGLSPAVIQAALDQLRVEGHYQRIIDEVASARQS
jgi:hypothetical protein